MEEYLAQLILFRPEGALEQVRQARGRMSARIVSELVAFNAEYGLSGDVWQNYLTFFLMNSENPFSLSCEMHGATSPALDKLAAADCELLRRLFFSDLSYYLADDAAACAGLLKNADFGPSKKYFRRIAEQIAALRATLSRAENAEAFRDALKDYYGRRGAGALGLFKAFRLGGEGPSLKPVLNADSKRFADIVGYELQKAQVAENTEAFLAGKKANNVLLYGDGGTGKSTTVKALMGEYYDRGLRMIELYKSQFSLIGDLLNALKMRNYKFIVYLDDLSFEEFETDYKFLKAVIDGGLEIRPDNVLIYATSNRRHLIRETFSDRNDMETVNEIHRSDTVQEKTSLAARFGLSVFYPSPNQAQYLEIVRELARKFHLETPLPELERRALQWQQRYGGKSGRTAEQFVHAMLFGTEDRRSRD